MEGRQVWRAGRHNNTYNPLLTDFLDHAFGVASWKSLVLYNGLDLDGKIQFACAPTHQLFRRRRPQRSEQSEQWQQAIHKNVVPK